MQDENTNASGQSLGQIMSEHHSSGKAVTPKTGFSQGRFASLASALALTLLAQPATAKTYPAPRLDFTPAQIALADAVRHDPDLAAFYGGNGLRPVFSDPEGAARRAALAEAVARAPEHGLPAARYVLPQAGGLAGEVALAGLFTRWVNDLTRGLVDPRRLASQIKRRPEGRDAGLALADFAAAADPRVAIDALAPSDPFYLALQRALNEGGALIAPPGTPPAPAGVWRPGMRDPALADLRARLAVLGFDPGTGAADLYDAGMAEAVTRFQHAAGLGADGIAGPRTIARLNGNASDAQRAVLLAMERWRWLPEDLGPRHVWVNLPEYTTRIVQDGAVVFETRAVIGKATEDFETPEFSDRMEYLVFNPAWNVPRSITVREYLPKLRANPHAVGHIDIVDSRGRVVPRGQIDFSRYTAANFPYRMRQKPSDDNALGQVKFLFPNEWNIYLHDTPTRWLFDQAQRAHSHGCIRIHRPLDLAAELLGPQLADPRASIQAALARSGEQWVRLTPAVPVHLVYFTTFPDAQGRLRHAPDIYGRDAPLWRALQEVGLGGV